MKAVTVGWIVSIECLKTWELTSLPLCSWTLSINRLPVSPLYPSLQLGSGQTTLYVRPCWCSLLVLSFILNLVPNFVPVKTNATSCPGKSLVKWRLAFLNACSTFFHLEGRILLCCLTLEGSRLIILWFIWIVKLLFNTTNNLPHNPGWKTINCDENMFQMFYFFIQQFFIWADCMGSKQESFHASTLLM